MTTQATTTRTDPCPGCDEADEIRWVASTPETDEWSCRGCGTEWTIAVELPQVPR